LSHEGDYRVNYGSKEGIVRSLTHNIVFQMKDHYVWMEIRRPCK